MSQVKLISATQGAGELSDKGPQDIISYVARVSNPANQQNFRTSGGLLRYCINHNHWSVFETAGMPLEINTNRGIAAQIIRHRSFTYQEFSQRYADSNLLGDIELPELRRQDDKNRQNSIDDLEPEMVEKFNRQMNTLFSSAFGLYNQMLQAGVAKECARFVLPLATPTKLYMTGSCRSWIHYINLRSAHGTQKEHMDIANACKKIFIEQFPAVSEALDWD